MINRHFYTNDKNPSGFNYLPKNSHGVLGTQVKNYCSNELRSEDCGSVPHFSVRL